jgi:glycosyltransferase involved in cell wall biosynthesis
MLLSINYSDSRRGGLTPVVRIVSVIIPAYNASATIERTLRSVMAQTFAHLEIIVVDDGSTDHTVAIVERVGREDPRIALLRQRNEGVATARNRGIAYAHGEFIAPIDADDIWHPHKIEKQIALMEKGGDQIGLVYCYSRLINEKDIVTPQEGRQDNARGDVYALLVLSNFVGNGSSPLIRRTYLQEVGGFDSSLRSRGAQGCEDLGVYLSIAERWQIDLVPEYLVGYRSAAGNMSGNHVTMARSWEIVIAIARRGHPELPLKLFRWARGNFYRWLGFGCLGRGQVWRSLYYLSIAFCYDPAETCSFWVVRNYLTRIVRPRIEGLWVARFVYRIRDLLRLRRPSSSIWDMKYLEVDPTVNEVVPVRPRETRRQSIARSLTVLSNKIVVERAQSTKPKA